MNASQRNASSAVKQGGYALLLSVFMLLGMGGLWMGGVALQSSQASRNETLALSRARDALIFYAVNYIDHYGPQGAGLGHLPCPDTDKPGDSAAASWHRDGPNPPCGRQAVQIGWLPRHVNVALGRYHFHTRNRQRLLYAVSGKFVNNPVGRDVNPLSVGDIRVGQFDDVIAILAAPTLDTDAHQVPHWFDGSGMPANGAAYTLIRIGDIRAQIMQRAGAWLVLRMNTALEIRCQKENASSSCLQHIEKHAQCDFQEKQRLLHWLYSGPVPLACAEYQLRLDKAFVLLENAPLNRHWFVRNEWHRFIDVSIDDDCAITVSLSCRFQLESTVGPLLSLRLKPGSAP